MKFSVKRDVENRVFSTVIAFEEFGKEDLTAEQEMEILKDYGNPEIEIGGAFVREGETDPAIVLTSKKMKLDESFTVGYSLSIDEAGSDTAAAELCELFENKIEERIAEAITALSLPSAASGYVVGSKTFIK